MGLRLSYALRPYAWIVGIAAAVGPWFIESPLARGAGLYVACALLTPALYRAAAARVAFLVTGLEEKLGHAVGFVAAGSYCAVVEPSGWQRTIAIILASAGGCGLLVAFVALKGYREALSVLTSACAAEGFPSPRVPYILVHSMPGFAEYYAMRLTTQMRVWFTLAAIREMPIMFMSARHFDRHDPGTIMKVRECAIAHIVVAVARDVAENPEARPEAQLLTLVHTSTHVTMALWIRGGGLDAPTDVLPTDERMDVPARLDGLVADQFVATVLRRVVRTSMPLIDPDKSLADDLRVTCQRMATDGWAPVSDAYLRFRLAQSHVERFVALLDSCEAMAKMSTVLLFAAAKSAGRQGSFRSAMSAPNAKAAKPTFGSWTAGLRRLVADAQVCGIAERMRGFWTADVTEDQMAAVRQSGFPLPYQGQEGHTQLEWLDWIRDLRNRTKGHGVVSEDNAESLWGALNVGFLRLVEQSQEWMLAGSLRADHGSESKCRAKGWRRNGVRLEGCAHSTNGERPPAVEWEWMDGKSNVVSPFIRLEGASVLLLDSWDEAEDLIEFMDYSTGERRSGSFLRTVSAEWDRPVNL